MQDMLTAEQDFTNFTNQLPPKMQSLIQLQIHMPLFEKISLFKLHNYSTNCYAWMSSALRTSMREAGQFVYQQGDFIHSINFL